MAEKGFIIVADITGYTAYLNDSELEHAQEILESLLKTILKEIHPPLTVSRTEGDAVISYTSSDAFIMGQTMLDTLEKIYCAFQTELEHNDRNTSCPCTACQNMQNLDLKFVTHFGEFGLQHLGNITELVGSDVNLTHRLLKNHIIEETGVAAYAFFSQAAIDALNLGDLTTLMQPHTETYEQLGEVSGWVYDLKPVWQRSWESLRVVVTPEESDVSFEEVYSVSPAVLWEYLNDPDFRARFRFSRNDGITPSGEGRLDVGATYHCMHGDKAVPQMILDWRPFDYVTTESREPRFGMETRQKETIFLQRVPEGTKMTVHFTRKYHQNLLKDLLLNMLNPLIVRPERKRGIPFSLAEIGRIIEEDRESGRLKMVEISAETANA